VGYNSVADNTGLQFIRVAVFCLRNLRNHAKFRRKFKLIAVQGHSRSSTSVPIESTYSTSY